MNKQLNFNYTFYNEEEKSIVIDLKDHFPYDFCLSLLLLNYDLKNEIIIKNKKNILLFKKDSKVTTVPAFIIDKNKISLLISDIQIEYWLSYFLKYYRDEYADVDHIHTEFYNSNNECLDFTIQVAQYKEPLSEEEAIKALRNLK